MMLEDENNIIPIYLWRNRLIMSQISILLNGDAQNTLGGGTGELVIGSVGDA